jgi:hypothetical protein
LTKGWEQRSKKQIGFGIGKTLEEQRGNCGLTMVQRDNIWHPYYEVKLEEEDLGTRFRAQIAQKKDASVGDGAIAALNEKLIAEQNILKDRNFAVMNPTAATNEKKAYINPKELQERLRMKEINEPAKMLPDPYAVKLSNMPNATTEEEIMDAMKKFGLVKKCRIPTNRETGRPLGFAIVVFDAPEQATRAIEEGEITVDLACLDIEQAMQSRRPPFGGERREGGGGYQDRGDRPF